MIVQILDPNEKRRIAKGVLHALPDWFGMPEYTDEYIENSAAMPFWAAYSDEEAVGFVALKNTSPHTAEVYVMGVLPEYHRCGLGRQLYEAFEAHASAEGCCFAQVKTVKMGHYDEYDRTNRFYMAMGFRELECFPKLWDEWNPCQIYVKAI